MRKLVIAEKPSVASNIANVLGARTRGDGFFINDNYIVSWCIGHLVELQDAADYDARYKVWNVSNLPIIPQQWRFKAVKSTQKQLRILRELMNREDVSSLVCATDAGREGEAIFRRVYNICRCRKPVERLWVSSLEESGIRKAFSEMKDDHEYDNLFKAADARNKADWLVGINATILYTLLFSDRSVYSVGRVQTPTLKMIADRDAAIENFVPQPFYTVTCDLESEGVEWSLSSARYDDRKEAEEALAIVRKTAPVITDIERKEVKKFPPPLYSLNDLQRDANRYHGFTADKTLTVLQELYEKKLTTYPRTDSQFLTDDMEGTFAMLTNRLRKGFSLDESCSFRPAKVCVNNSKVSDHHAILVTGTYIDKLARREHFAPDEEAILSLIRSRMVMALSTPLVLSETKVSANSEGVLLTATGQQIVSPGFLAVEKIMRPEVASKRKGTISLPGGISKGPVKPVTVRLEEGKTSPPKPYTDDTLLLAMEKAGAKEMDKDVERKGIGTSATRASIIKRLETVGHIARVKGKGKAASLHATDKGKRLLAAVPEAMSSPELTAEWENKLLGIERGTFDVALFDKEIKDYVISLVRQESVKVKATPGNKQGVLVGKCPACGKDVYLRGKAAACGSCNFKLYTLQKVFTIDKEIRFDETSVRALLSDGKCKVRIRENRNGKTESCVVKFTITGYNEKGWATVAAEFEGKGEA